MHSMQPTPNKSPLRGVQLPMPRVLYSPHSIGASIAAPSGSPSGSHSTMPRSPQPRDHFGSTQNQHDTDLIVLIEDEETGLTD